MTALARGFAILEALETPGATITKSRFPTDELAAPQWQFETGAVFGRWVVTGPTLNEYRDNGKGHVYKYPMTPVKCSCKAGTVSKVRANYLGIGKTMSCGCTISAAVRTENDVTWATLLAELEERTA